MFSTPPKPISFWKRIFKFATAHWRGIILLIGPLIALAALPPFPPEKHCFVAYALLVMTIYWVSECIPVQVTAFIPVAFFPLTGVMDTPSVSKCYVNDMILMFLGSIMLACALEQSGLHRRIALLVIRCIGCSHKKMMFAVCFITMFFSMWITNTAATVMMVPIMFALLGVYEKQQLLKMYETDAAGEKRASKITTGYFCAITFSATIGGIGTLVGTATNLVFKGIYARLGGDEDHLSFPLFSAFSIPLMLALEFLLYIYMLFMYLGVLRPNSKDAKSCKITPAGLKAARKTVDDEIKGLGKITMHEIMVLLLFSLAMILFFTRSPKMFNGWGDLLAQTLEEPPSLVKDSSAAMFVIFLMLVLPSSTRIVKNCKAKFKEDLPSSPIMSCLDWHTMNRSLPYSFMFLLGGGFALSTAANSSGLNAQIADFLKGLKDLPNAVVLLIIIFLTTLITNLASNVAVANVLVPIVIQLSGVIGAHALWYTIAAGFSASFCFMLPVGTPGNLVVQSAASIPTSRMVIAGAIPTVFTIIVTWAYIYMWAPVIWPFLNTAAVIAPVTEPPAAGGGTQ